jgi:DNA-binding PadR family transcriptional regulator
MPPLGGRRGRIVYQLTAEGKEHLQTVLSSAGPAAWEDENFDVRFALFAQTDAETRLRILEGRRTRLTERLEAVRESAARPASGSTSTRSSSSVTGSSRSSVRCAGSTG